MICKRSSFLCRDVEVVFLMYNYNNKPTATVFLLMACDYSLLLSSFFQRIAGKLYNTRAISFLKHCVQHWLHEFKST